MIKSEALDWTIGTKLGRSVRKKKRPLFFMHRKDLETACVFIFCFAVNNSQLWISEVSRIVTVTSKDDSLVTCPGYVSS